MSSISLDIITFSEEGPSISPGNASHPAIGDSLIFCEYSKYRSISTEVNLSGFEIETFCINYFGTNNIINLFIVYNSAHELWFNFLMAIRQRT